MQSCSFERLLAHWHPRNEDYFFHTVRTKKGGNRNPSVHIIFSQITGAPGGCFFKPVATVYGMIECGLAFLFFFTADSLHSACRQRAGRPCTAPLKARRLLLFSSSHTLDKKKIYR
jgi:hypothetical protein